MRTKSMPTAIVAALVTGLLAVSVVTNVAQTARGTDSEALAQKLVSQSAGIRQGDLVLISGGIRDAELLENIAVNVRKQGAFPLVTLGSDRMIRRMYTDVSPKYDSQPRDLDLKLAQLITAMITVDFNETEGLLADIPPARLATVGKTFAPVTEQTLKRNVKQVNLGNGLYPTSELAKRFGIPQAELSKIFWDGVNVDYLKLQATGHALKTTLATGKEVQITNPNGTDLRVRIEGRPVFVSDGIISAEDVKRGGAAVQVWLPAGEVFLAPVPGTAEGKIVVDRQPFQGKHIEGLTLTFQAGKLTSMTAKSGLEPLKALYDASGAGKDIFAIVDIGINPQVRIPAGSRMVAWMPAGMVTVGIGNNTWAGGDNNVPFGLTNHLPGSSVKIDGKVVVDSGALKFQGS